MWLLSSKNMQIKLDKLTFKAWEIITWSVNLDFSEEVKADKLTIWLLKKSSTRNMTWYEVSSNWSHMTKDWQYYINTVTLGLAWVYKTWEYKFELVIPDDAIVVEWWFSEAILQKIPEQFRNIASILLELFFRKSVRYYRFEVMANLDIPWAIDANESVAISVNPK